MAFGSTEEDVVAIMKDYINTFNGEIFIPLRHFNRAPDATIFAERDGMVVVLKRSNQILGKVFTKNARVKEIIDNNTDIITELNKLAADANFTKRVATLSVLAQAQVQRHQVVFHEILQLLHDYSDTFNRSVFVPLRTASRNIANVLSVVAEIPEAQIVLRRGNGILENSFSGTDRMREIIDNNKDILKEIDNLAAGLKKVEASIKNINQLVETQAQRNKTFLAASTTISKAA